jgi:hypothetical protein
LAGVLEYENERMSKHACDSDKKITLWPSIKKQNKLYFIFKL